MWYLSSVYWTRNQNQNKNKKRKKEKKNRKCACIYSDITRCLCLVCVMEPFCSSTMPFLTYYLVETSSKSGAGSCLSSYSLNFNGLLLWSREIHPAISAFSSLFHLFIHNGSFHFPSSMVMIVWKDWSMTVADYIFDPRNFLFLYVDDITSYIVQFWPPEYVW